MLALRYTLGEQKTLDKELPLCVARGAGISPVCSRRLYATGPVQGAKYNYADATPEQLERARKIDAVCKRHGVPLAAAALHCIIRRSLRSFRAASGPNTSPPMWITLAARSPRAGGPN